MTSAEIHQVHKILNRMLIKISKDAHVFSIYVGLVLDCMTINHPLGENARMCDVNTK